MGFSKKCLNIEEVGVYEEIDNGKDYKYQKQFMAEESRVKREVTEERDEYLSPCSLGARLYINQRRMETPLKVHQTDDFL